MKIADVDNFERIVHGVFIPLESRLFFRYYQRHASPAMDLFSVKLRFEHAFDALAERLFAFHENPDNLTLLLSGWPTFRMVANDGHIRVGSITRVQEQMGPIRVSMTFEHFIYEPPRRFGERQVRGPFKKFEHIHEFHPAESGTILFDQLEVLLPWYLGGSLALKLFVAPKLRRFFAVRHAALESLVREHVIEPRNCS